MKRLLTTAIAIASIASACATAPPLPIVRQYDVVPLVDGPAIGSLVGKCVVFEGSQPVVSMCPVTLAKVTSKSKFTKARKRSTFTHGVFRPTDPDIAATGLSVAFELATYGENKIQWSEEATPADIRKFAQRCVHGGPQYVVTREVSGCGFVANAQRSSAYWTIGDLAAKGAIIGTPEGFWSQAPEGERNITEAKCSQKRVVMVQLVSWRQVCAKFKQQAADHDEPLQPDPTKTAGR